MAFQANTAATSKPYVKDTTTQNFVADVIEESQKQPVLVDFWAPWCGPCRQLTPIIEKAVAAANGKVKLVKMNIDEHPAIPGQLGIQSIPAVIAFKNGRPLDAFMGALPESQVKEFIDRISGGASSSQDAASFIKAAEEALEKKDMMTAMQNFAAALSLDPEHIVALTGLAQIYLQAGEIEQAQAIYEQIPESKRNEPAVVSLKAALDLQEKAAQSGDLATLEQKLAAEPNNPQARYDYALALAAHHKRDAAVEVLLEMIKHQRDWNEGAAHKQLLQFFEAWGFNDDAAIAGRRKLSTLLFS